MADQVIYLEKFVESSTSMPAELNRLLRTIKELDLKSEELGAQIQDNFEALLAKVPGKTPPEEIAALRKRIEEDQAQLIQWAEEKIELGRTGHVIVDDQMLALENDIKSFQDEMGIDIDHGYGIDDYGMEMHQPEPDVGRRSGSRMQFGGGYDSLEPQMMLEPRSGGGGGGGRKSTQIPLSLSRQQSGYGSEGYATGSDVMGWDQPKRTGNRRSSAAVDGFGSRRRAASAAIHATTAAVAALEEDDYGANAAAVATGGGGGGGADLGMGAVPVVVLEPFVHGLAHAAKEPQAPGRAFTEQDINQGLIGQIAEVFWPDDGPTGSLWYLVKIESVDLQTMTASIRYQNGEMENQLSLLEVARDGHMMLVNMAN